VHRRAAEGYRVLVSAPFGRDADSVAQLLSHNGYSTCICPTLGDVARSFDDHVGAILITQEALGIDMTALAAALDAQPAWSDVPFILLVNRRTGVEVARRRLPDAATNVITLERPLGSSSLLSAVASAMRSRQKQFEMRDRLAELAASQAALAASENELRLITDALPVLIGFIDRDCVYRFANKAYEDWFFRPASDVIGRHVREIAGEDGFAARKPWIDRALAGEEVRFDLAWPHRDGAPREAEIRYIPRTAADGTVDGFHVFVADITERKAAMEVLRATAETQEKMVAERTAELHAEMASRARAEAALRQSQKMEAVGQLTGGIAHDFNNMLTGVIGGLDIVRRRIAAGRLDDIERFMDAASSSAQRAASLTQRLLAFARRQSLDPRPIDVNDLAQSLDDLIRRTIGEQVSLRLALDNDCPSALADANQLENAILNLAINARDAMPNGGLLTIETSAVDLDDAYVADKPDLAPGRYVVIAVSDTGVGMTPEILEKVYEPFFTTKPIGQGTGLGLSMVYGFARQSGGQVRIHSTAGEGTSVKIYLPAASAEPVAAQVVSHAVPDGNGQTVLLVEDDESVRLLVREVLAELGYRTVEVPEAGAAIRILASGRPVDLMISDVGLPGMNGRQLAEIAREHRPDLPILFITGYAENAAIRAGFLGTNMSMVTKPFTLETLAQKIDEMLTRGA